MRERTSPDFIEAIARGFDVVRTFDGAQSQTLAEVAQSSGLARPTARRILITLQQVGYVVVDGGRFELTPRVLELGVAYFSGVDFWQAAMPRLRALVHHTNESSSIAQLDGSDVVYVARVAVPKLVTLSVAVGTRFPAAQTSLGKVLLSSLSHEEVDAVLATPSRSGVEPTWHPSRDELDAVLAQVRSQGWAISDQQLAPAIRSVAAPIRRADGTVFAAMNVNAHAAETSIERLQDEHLPHLLRAAADLSVDHALRSRIPAEIA
ncbi:IclR family transcriptional regulator C-terminal domain-containing protein [Agrococcus sp. ARC_14]|uniref:IclR family transcriptional regulator domain-containing protein n=1 Tax=Agrococcus sp. ARC_14 TaxID=2919927 RepID=UPI001F054603|nr:IclR family transcriptional regulator C-terminal domain-containing protein [Agrococcus sp. ARC_14]MCH1881356.1 helix-turn-helix domain-containing protein [Agrococcus sp. ARC_14]